MLIPVFRGIIGDRESEKLGDERSTALVFFCRALIGEWFGSVEEHDEDKYQDRVERRRR